MSREQSVKPASVSDIRRGIAHVKGSCHFDKQSELMLTIFGTVLDVLDSQEKRIEELEQALDEINQVQL